MIKNAILTDYKTFPAEILPFLKGAVLYDSSCSEEAKVYFSDKDRGYFIKTAAQGTLENEATMTGYFHSKGLSSEVCLYLKSESDYLITKKINGKDGTDECYLSDPVRLCKVFAETLVCLHQTDFSGCPLKSKSSGLVTDPVYTALIHGDYCLPNIMLDDFRFTGLVDLDYAGIGDPHRDISSALWTLNHNLRTDKYNDLFLDCYGREKIDFKQLKLWEGL